MFLPSAQSCFSQFWGFLKMENCKDKRLFLFMTTQKNSARKEKLFHMFSQVFFSILQLVDFSNLLNYLIKFKLL